MSDQRNHRLLTNTIWFAIGNFGSRILSFLLVPLYTGILLPEEYGKIDLITTTVNLSIPLLSLSICDAVFRFSMDSSDCKDEVFTEGITISLLSSILSLSLYPVLKALLPSIIEYWWYFWLLFTTMTIANTMTMFLQGLEKTRILAFQGMVYTFTFSILNVILLVIVHIGIYGYLISQISANVISILFMVLRGKLYDNFHIKSFNCSHLRQMLKYSIPLIFSSIAWWIMSSIDKYMILYMCGEKYNGLYAVAHKIPSLVTVFTSFFVSAWQISAVTTKDDSDSVKYFRSVYTNLFAFSAVLSFLVIIFNKLISHVLFLGDFFQAWTMVPCLIAASLFSTLSMLLGAQFTAYKKSSLHLTSNVIAMVSNAFFNFICIHLWGPVGVTIGTMLSYLLMLLYRQYKVRQIMNDKECISHICISFLIIVIAVILPAFDLKFWISCDVILFVLFLRLNNKSIMNICKFLLGMTQKRRVKND